MVEMSVIDSERDQAIRELTRHCGDGRLTLDELEERIAAAYDATTADDLRLLLRDLPATTAPPPLTNATPRSEPDDEPEPLEELVEQWVDKGCSVGIDKDKNGVVGVGVCIAGFVLLFNGMFWLALAVWFLLPMMLKSAHRG